MLQKLIRTCVVAGLGLGLCGCAYLYRAEDDKAAQAASKSFNDAAIGKALEAEREALVKSQQERQELVKRSQFALRDATLSVVIGGTQGPQTWGALKDQVEHRLIAVRGPLAPAALPANCNRQMGIARSDYDFALTKTLLAADKVAIAAAAKGAVLPLSCKQQPSVVPAVLVGDATVGALVKRYDETCQSAAVADACVKAHSGSGGETKAIDDRLAAIAAERKAIEKQIKDASNEYKDALAAADLVKPTAGAAKLLAAKLQEKLDAIDKLSGKLADVNSKADKLGFSELANLESLERRKAVLEAYIAALQGQDSGSTALSQHRVYLIANLVNRATEKPVPPTAGIVLQAELYRQQIAASQARIKRMEESVELLKLRRAHLTNELAELHKATGHLEAAVSSSTCDMNRSLYDGLLIAKDCEIHAAGALLAFNNAWTFGRMPAEQADYRLIDVQELTALDESEAALRQTESVIKAALDQIVKLNASGFKPEDVANLWQALGITAIAVRVK